MTAPKQESQRQDQGDIIIYQAEDGKTKIDVRFVDETVWLTQQQLCNLYQTSKSNISEHIKHIFEEGELEPEAVVRKFRTTIMKRSNRFSRNLRKLFACWQMAKIALSAEAPRAILCGKRLLCCRSRNQASVRILRVHFAVNPSGHSSSSKSEVRVNVEIKSCPFWI